jgi:hypothetical protein
MGPGAKDLREKAVGFPGRHFELSRPNIDINSLKILQEANALLSGKLSYHNVAVL